MTTKTFYLDKESCRRVYVALHARANAIETGDPDVDAKTAENMRDPEHERRYGRSRGPQPRVLSTEQMREVVALRDLAARFLS